MVQLTRKRLAQMSQNSIAFGEMQPVMHNKRHSSKRIDLQILCSPRLSIKKIDNLTIELDVTKMQQGEDGAGRLAEDMVVERQCHIILIQ